MSIDPRLLKLKQFDDAQRAVVDLEANVGDAIDRIAQQALPKLTPTARQIAAYVAKVDDLVVTSGTLTVTLPVATSKNNGRVIGVLVQSGTVTVGSQSTVQGAVSDALATAGLYLYVSTGTSWWRAPTGAGGGAVASVTAGSGLVNSGTAANPIIDMASAGGTLTITANNAEVAAAIVAGAALGASSVQSVTAADATIVIAGTAANPTVAVGDSIATEASLEEVVATIVEALADETRVLIAIDAKLSIMTKEFPFEDADEVLA